MEPSSIPLELISYRGLLKSAQDIVKGNFMNKQNSGEKNEKSKNMLDSIKFLLIFTVRLITYKIERVLLMIMLFYDNYIYSSLKKKMYPIVESMPRMIAFRNNKTILIINSNIITLLRTLLFIPIVWFLKHNYSVYACWTVVLHSFFGTFDGIVARVHGGLYPNQDDPVRSRFLIAFCNKIVNLLIFIVLMQTLDFSNSSNFETMVFCSIIYCVIIYDVVVAVLRVQGYFEAILIKEKASMASKATLEWKLKTKLESVGIAALCLASDKSHENPVMNFWSFFGLSFLIFTIRMAHKTLETEMKAVHIFKAISADVLLINSDEIKIEKKETNNKKHFNRSKSLAIIQENDSTGVYEQEFIESDNSNTGLETNIKVDNGFDKESDKIDNKQIIDNRVDKVYTIGCFDLFHHGHIRLIERMREVGKKVIIGVHDSRSIYKLKNRVPVDSTEKRMLNVKEYADEVFCIAGTDPSNYIKAIVGLTPDETAIYIRGDDMPFFPAREVVEKLMPIKLLPYTQGVSSTQIRKEKFSHVSAHDEEYLEKNS